MISNKDFFKFAIALLFVSVITCLGIIFITTRETYNKGFQDGKYYCERMVARTGSCNEH